MTECWINYLTWSSILFGFASAASWLRASIVKVTREKEIARRTKEAKKRGETPNLAGVTLDGWDMSGTFKAQAKWNAIAAFLGAFAVGFQAIIRLIETMIK